MIPEIASAEIARIVSQVTGQMLGITFTVSDLPPNVDSTWKCAALPINGAVPLTVSVTADAPCARQVGSRMFAIALDRVDEQMIADSLCEVVNMAAGLLKSALRIDQPLGLPKMRASVPFASPADAWHCHFLKAEGGLNLVLAVATRVD